MLQPKWLGNYPARARQQQAARRGMAGQGEMRPGKDKAFAARRLAHFTCHQPSLLSLSLALSHPVPLTLADLHSVSQPPSLSVLCEPTVLRGI